MTKFSLLFRGWQLKLVDSVAIVGTLFIAVGESVLAQIVPDNTLGAEGSVVTPDVIKGISSDRIDGGATRGANLFHSFQEFNVGEGRGAYFANLAGIENILTRVTGGNPSNILGRLGVLGEANLFLLNPNGIVFGSNASLDIQGSFVATTAQRIQLGDSGYFSAVQPQTSSLLSVSPGALFFSEIANQPSSIINQGNLSTGKHLTLAAGNLDLQGQLFSGGDLTLQAQDTVRVRDSAAIPFIASTGGNLLVQGNHRVDIFALSHPESGLFSGGTMVLRSANTVGGDAHYWSGGNFRIEQLDGSLGNLYSPNDPIIRANGDVVLNSYQGASLHILGGGRVEIPNYVWIQGSDPANGLIDTVTLSDGTSVPINGQTEPTLDIRAGTTAFGNPFTNTGTPTSADIKIGTILFADADFNLLPGRVLLANQYQPNTALTGSIQVTATQGGDLAGIALLIGNMANSGSVALDSRGNITLNGTVYSSTGLGRGGDVTLLANQNITTRTIWTSSNALDSGDIRLISRNGAIDTTAGILDTATINGRNGGNVTLEANGDITTFGIRSDGGRFGGSGNITLTSGTGKVSVTDSSLFRGFLLSQTYGLDKGGDINITAVAVSIDNALVDASTYGQADSGRMTITASDTVSVAGGSSVRSLVGGVGNSGGITINTGSLSVTELSELNSSVTGGGEGRAGDIVINARDHATFDGGFARSRLEQGGVGRGGDIRITTGSLLLTGIPSDVADNNIGQLVAATFGDGDAGNVIIQARDSVVLDGRGSDIWSLVAADRGVGNAGNISIESGSFEMLNGARLVAATENRGDAGNIAITTGPFSMIDSSITNTVSASGIGEGGDIKIDARSLNLTSSALITGVVGGQGNAGDLIINVRGNAVMDGGGQGNRTTVASYLRPGGGNTRGNAASITIEADSLSLTRGVEIATGVGDNGSSGTVTGDGGNISIQLKNALDLSQSFITSRIFANGIGNAGNIDIKTGSVSSYQSVISATTQGRGDAGGISVGATDTISLADSDISTAVQLGAIGDARRINITARSISLTDGAQLNAITSGQGNAGNITITASDRLSVSGTNATITPTDLFKTISPGFITAPDFVDGVSSGIFTSTNSSGVGSNITVNTSDFKVSDGAVVDARTTASGRGGAIGINTNRFEATNGGQLTAITSGSGTAGSITLNATDSATLSGSDPTYAARVAQFGSQTDTYGKTKVGNQGAASGLFVNATANSTGNGGDIEIVTSNFNLTDSAQISASTSGSGRGGDITVNATQSLDLNQASLLAQSLAQSNDAAPAGSVTINTPNLTARNGAITTSSEQSSGGGITITADKIRLYGDSDITTFVAQGAGGGGDIKLTASSILAFDDSDILAYAPGGTGGNITLETPAFFGENYRPASRDTAPDTLDDNNRVDVNATGAVEGVITIPDTSFIQNSLTELPENQLDTDSLLANSCIVRRNQPTRGSFTITGTGGLPQRPGDAQMSTFPTVDIETLPSDGTPSTTNPNRPWQKGDPIVEPQGVYRLANGKLVLSRECP